MPTQVLNSKRLHMTLIATLCFLGAYYSQVVNVGQFTTCSTCSIDYYWCQTTITCLASASGSNCPNLIMCPEACPLPIYSCENCTTLYYWCPTTSSCLAASAANCPSIISTPQGCPAT